MKKIFVLGSTGSIGVNSLNVIRNFAEKFQICGLTTNSRIDELEKQINEFHPELVVVKDEQAADELRSRKLNSRTEILSGDKNLLLAASSLDYDILIGAMVGFSGLAPTIEAVRRGKRIALANKETLVVAGELVTVLCKEHSAEIIPVDSEHSAIYQCLVGEELSEVEKIILTASGGPFLNKEKSFFETATIEQALNHPNWKMGNKITIDSASMMNKGLEVIEAHWLFGLPKEKIDVVIHPQSIIHSMVQFRDGSIKAQLGLPDMKLPIQYALSFPERLQNQFERTNLPLIGSFTFFEPDYNKFECLKLAYDVMESGGTAPCILNAANEIAVDKFLKGKIKFSQIPYLINKALNKLENHFQPDLEVIFNCDKLTRDFVSALV
ncbi:MAG: 1-deoxy-D-xylulose-5-phosphate reductoisomerase [Ignavibacteriaceae bacterium]|nr:1-deoxy-D-xylulose-5-phosphate reductoisomerase [Ignavibacteriaceae bacterium]